MIRDEDRVRRPEPTAGIPSQVAPRFPAAPRGLGLTDVVLLVVVLLAGHFLGAILVLAWVWISQTPWRDLGFVRPNSWLRVIALGVVGGVIFKLFMKAVLMPLLVADPTNGAYHELVGNGAALPGALFTVVVGGGLGEELIWRGYLFDRLGKLLGSSIRARIAILIVGALLFGLAHYSDQGLAGALQAMVTGTVFGCILMTTRSLWLPIVMHAAFDVAAVLIIYWGIESRVAHWIFR